MRSYRKLLLLSVLSVTLCGCANLWHELQPSRLWRANRGSAPSSDPEFSQTSVHSSLKLVRHEGSAEQTGLKANRTDATFVRGQIAE